jgi:O-antigen ligase
MLDVSLWRSYWVPLFLFFTSAVTLVIPSGYSFGFYGLCFTGLVLWLFVRHQLLSADARPFLVPILIYALGQLVIGLREQLFWRSVDSVIPFLLMIFAVWLLRRCKPNADWFWLGLAVGAVGAACFSGYQALGLGIRAGGYLHPIQFGNIALLLGVLCMVRALITLKLTWMNALMWIGFASGVVASVWSQTRGGWVAIVLIFFWILMHATKQWTWLRKLTTVFVLIASIATLGAQFGLNKVIQSRVTDAIVETVAFVETNNQDSPVGSRLAMWRFAVQHIGDAPLLGIGKQGWITLRDQGITNGELSAVFISRLTHLHNEYLDTVIKRGLIGLVFLLQLYLGPMIFFFRPYLNAMNVEVKSLAMVGMVIPMMFMDFGLTQVFLSHNSGRMVLVSLWACAAALLLNAVETSKLSIPRAPSR